MALTSTFFPHSTEVTTHQKALTGIFNHHLRQRCHSLLAPKDRQGSLK